MKAEHVTDPGGHVGPPGERTDKEVAVVEDGASKVKQVSETSDSDSGLDTSSLRSNSKTNETNSPATNEAKQTTTATEEDNSTPEPAPVLVARRKNIPFMGLALKRNPDLSEIAKNEQKLCYACYECGSKMAKRQPLTRTNGILFMKNREDEVMADVQYASVNERAFTRSEIVHSWHYELEDHRGYCIEELDQMYYYQKRYNQKYGLCKQERTETPDLDENDGDTKSDEKLTTMAKIQNKLRKMTKKTENEKLTESSTWDHPPPSAAPRSRPSVISRPVDEENTDINFSGILQSTVLRQHCEKCVLRNKPLEYQNVLFVCQL